MSISALAWREARIRLRNPIFPLWDLLSPLVYLAVFGASFDRWLPGGAVAGGYGAFLLCGVLAMTTIIIAWNTSYAQFEDLRSGVFQELLTYPIRRRDLLLGKLLFNVGFALGGALLSLAVARWGMGVAIDARAALALLGLTVAGIAGWFFLYFWLVLTLRGFNAYQTATSALYLYLLFCSTMFYPAKMLPAALRPLAAWNPATWQIDLMRAAMGGGAGAATPRAALGFALFILAAFALANRTLNRTIE